MTMPKVIMKNMIINDFLSKKSQKNCFSSGYSLIRFVCFLVSFLKTNSQKRKNTINVRAPFLILIYSAYVFNPINRIFPPAMDHTKPAINSKRSFFIFIYLSSTNVNIVHVRLKKFPFKKNGLIQILSCKF
jgi:hypothetical protein